MRGFSPFNLLANYFRNCFTAVIYYVCLCCHHLPLNLRLCFCSAAVERSKRQHLENGWWGKKAGVGRYRLCSWSGFQTSYHRNWVAKRKHALWVVWLLWQTQFCTCTLDPSGFTIRARVGCVLTIGSLRPIFFLKSNLQKANWQK